MARDHLFMVARDWATHPGEVRNGSGGIAPAPIRPTPEAASVVGQSIVEGLFGVQMVGARRQLSPRLDDLSGGVRVYQRPRTCTWPTSTSC